jgi:uncharacterized membrane protein (UPF0127 family)
MMTLNLARLRRPLLALALLCAAPFAQAQSPMPVVELTVGMYRIEAELAANEADRELGLMLRRQMPAGHGMVFAFTADRAHCMWMKNTLLPLSVAFMDAEGTILNIEDMQPQTEDNHCAAKPARYALEMNQGWFREKGIKAGTRITGISRLQGAGR